MDPQGARLRTPASVLVAGALALALGLGGVPSSDAMAATATLPVERSSWTLLLGVCPLVAPGAAARATLDWADDQVYQIWRAYVLSRVVEVTLPVHEAAYYGPWDAPRDFEATEASSTGLITEWDRDYFITHDWSEYGQQILTMLPGDVVSINGRPVRVEGVFDYPKDAYLDEIRELCGMDTTVIQTCEPASDLNRIVYGH